VGKVFANLEVLKASVNSYAKKHLFTVRWSVEVNDMKRLPRARAVCSRQGRSKPSVLLPDSAPPNSSAASAAAPKARKKTSKRTGCRWLMTASQPRDSALGADWTITALELQHTPPCNPSKGQFNVLRKKRGIPVDQGVFDQLSSIVLTMNPDTCQIRDWIMANAIGMRTDAKGIGNLKARIKLYAVCCFSFKLLITFRSEKGCKTPASSQSA
jgi:hypothetical protein